MLIGQRNRAKIGGEIGIVGAAAGRKNDPRGAVRVASITTPAHAAMWRPRPEHHGLLKTLYF
jgi:hypothetical protein